MAKEKIVAQADLARIEAIIAEYQNQRWASIPLLERIQQEFGFIPPSSIGLIAKGLGLFPAQVQGVWWYDGAAQEYRFWVPGVGGDLSTMTGQFYNYLVLVTGACAWTIPLP